MTVFGLWDRWRGLTSRNAVIRGVAPPTPRRRSRAPFALVLAASVLAASVLAASVLAALVLAGFAMASPEASAQVARETLRRPEPPPEALAKNANASIEMDVSTRSVSVTSAFTGTQIVVFGAVAGISPVLSAEEPYDVVVIVEGTATPLVARRKSRVGGVWINTRAMKFDAVPSYYAISSTRPLRDFAPRQVLRKHGIGFQHVVMQPAPAGNRRIGPNEKAAFREAVVRVKQTEGLYKRVEDGVEFKGASLFRAEIRLPANVPVGPLTTRALLFRNGRVVAESSQVVTMRREGIERFIHDTAFERPLLYGLMTVFLAIAAGLIASAMFQANRR